MLAYTIGSIVLDKLTYVWVTELGQKFKPSLTTQNTKYEGGIQLFNINFRHVRIEAFPNDGYVPVAPIFGPLLLSKDTVAVELHDIYRALQFLQTSESESCLSTIKITGDTISIDQIVFCGNAQKSLKKRIENNQLAIIIGEVTMNSDNFHMEWSKAQYFPSEDLVLNLKELFPVDQELEEALAVEPHHDGFRCVCM